MSPAFFEHALHFRTWLEQNHASEAELIVGFRKVGTGMPSMTWPQSVDETLSYGWIDGVRKRIDDESYQIRFTPRRKDSIWSLFNIAKVQELSTQHRMKPAGVLAYEARNHKKTGVYAFERNQPAELTVEETRMFKKNAAAWKYFESSAPSYSRVMKHWVVSSKQPATRARRLEQLVQACAEQRRILR